MKEFDHITFKELRYLKKISKMTLKEAIPKIVEFRDKHGFTDKQVKNLTCIARDFNPKNVILYQIHI